MIGNLTIAGSVQELSFILKTRINHRKQQYSRLGIDIPRCKVIVIDDWDITYDQDDYICASILLPDAKSMECIVAGNLDTFRMLYWNKLENDNDVKEYLIVLLAGLMEKGFDYVFYADTINNPNLIPIMIELTTFLNRKLGLNFYSSDVIMENPNVLDEQSVSPEFRIPNKLAIQQYGYQNPDSPIGNLFVQF